MKTGWKRVKLGDVAEVLLGKMLDQKKNRGEFYPFLNNVAVRWGGFDLEGLGQMRFEEDELERYKIKQGDIVVCEGGESGRCAMWKDPTPILYQKALHRVRVKSEVDQCFMYYQLFYIFKSGKADALITGSTIKHLPRQAMLEVPIEFPPLPVQRRIAAVLGALDDAIELNRKMNANLEAQAQALFKSWFVDFASFGGKMPKEWKMGTLGEFADITMGSSPKGETLNDEGEGVIFYQGKTEFGWRFPGVRLYTTNPIRMAKKGDVLVSVRAPVGAMNLANNDCCIGRGIASVSSRYRSYIFYALQQAKDQFDVYDGQGTVFGCIDKAGMHNIKLIVPTEKDLGDFERIVNPLDELIAANAAESRKLAETRDALLPKLMGGEAEVG